MRKLLLLSYDHAREGDVSGRRTALELLTRMMIGMKRNRPLRLLFSLFALPVLGSLLSLPPSLAAQVRSQTEQEKRKEEEEIERGKRVDTVVEPAVRLEDPRMILEVDELLRARIYIRSGNRARRLTTREPPPFVQFRLKGGKPITFEADKEDVLELPLRTELGKGKRITLLATSPVTRGSVELKIHFDQYEMHPGIVAVQTELTLSPLSRTPLFLEHASAGVIELFTRKRQGGYWHFLGFGNDGQYQLASAAPGFRQGNSLSEVPPEAGPVLPLLDVWFPRGGLAVGYLEPNPPQAWGSVPDKLFLPIGVNDAGTVRLDLLHRIGREIRPGETWTSSRIFLSAHEGDFFQGLEIYGRWMRNRHGMAPPSESAAFEANWSFSGEPESLTLAALRGKLSALRALGIRWLVLDRRWFDAVGDWNPRVDLLREVEVELPEEIPQEVSEDFLIPAPDSGEANAAERDSLERAPKPFGTLKTDTDGVQAALDVLDSLEPEEGSGVEGEASGAGEGEAAEPTESIKPVKPKEPTPQDARAALKAFIKELHDQGFLVRMRVSPGRVSPGSGSPPGAAGEAAGPLKLVSGEATNPRAQLLAEHPDWVVLNRAGKPVVAPDGNYYLCPALELVLRYLRARAHEWYLDWRVDQVDWRSGWQAGRPAEGSGLVSAPPCYDANHKHESPEDSSRAFDRIGQILAAAAQLARPGAEAASGSAVRSPIWAPCAEPRVGGNWSARQVRLRIRTLRAVCGSGVAVFSEASDPVRFASTLGLGAVPDAKFDPEDPELPLEVEKWLRLDRRLRTSHGRYVNVYDLAFHKPEGHLIRRFGLLYYAFFAPQPGVAFRGRVRFRGLTQGLWYRVIDYWNRKELAVISSSRPRVMVEFTDFLLLQLKPEQPSSSE